MKPFENLLGDTCELRMLEFLLPLDGIAFDIGELAKEIGVSEKTVVRIVKKFMENNILIKLKNEENISKYKINLSSPIVKNIISLNNILIEQILGDEKLYEIYEYLNQHKESES